MQETESEPLGRGIRVTAWNAAALMHENPESRAAKLALLTECAMGADVVFLQETHGKDAESVVRCPQLAQLFFT